MIISLLKTTQINQALENLLDAETDENIRVLRIQLELNQGSIVVRISLALYEM